MKKQPIADKENPFAANFNYVLTVKYEEGYFTDLNTPLVQELKFGSSKPRTQEYMQKAYPHCTIISVK